MALTFPKAQAIKFIESGELSFNDSDICGCNTQEKWSYQFTTGDNICFQMGLSGGFSDELIENGSFEDGESSTVITDWARDVTNVEETNVTRVEDPTAPCGSFIAYWINGASTPNLARLEQTYIFEQGKTYKITLKAKIEYDGTTVVDILKLVVGGQEYFITPTTDWEEYTIFVTFNDAPTTTDFDILMNQISTDVTRLYVDCVSMVMYEECYLINHINNGCFELGQRQTETDSASFDNWTGDATESLTGGYDGGRCAVLPSIGNTIEQSNVLLDSTKHILKFWARADANLTNLRVTSEPSGAIIATVSLTTTWTQYTYTINNGTDENIKFESITDEYIYIDCVELISQPEVNIFIRDNDGNDIIVSEDDITIFDNAINVCIPVDNYDMPACFRICIETCLNNLFLNSNFSQGSGNLFTSWTLTQPSRTNLLKYSDDLTNAVWTKSGLTAAAGSITGNVGTAFKYVFYQLPAPLAGDYTLQLKAKYSTQQFIQVLWSGEGHYTNIDLINGTTSSFAGDTSTIRLQDDGYYLITITFAATVADGHFVALVDSLASARASTTSSVNTALIKNQMLESGLYATPYIPTTSATVTTSLGEFLQDATGGPNGSRCLKMWADNPDDTTNLSQSVTLEDGVEYTVRFWARVDVLYGNDYLTSTGGSTLINSTDWKEYEQTFTQVGTGSFNQIFDFTNDENYGFIYLDNITIIASDEIEATCSEDMQFTEELDPCFKELIWYNVSDTDNIVLDIDYSTGFKNRIRLNASFQNPQYIKEQFSKTLNGDISSINSIKIKKTNDFSVDALPEFIIDRLAAMLAVSNIEYVTEWCSVTESEVSVIFDKNSRLMNVTISLSPKGEYIADSTFNCR